MTEAPISMRLLDVIFKPITLRGFWWAAGNTPRRSRQSSSRRQR